MPSGASRRVSADRVAAWEGVCSGGRVSWASSSREVEVARALRVGLDGGAGGLHLGHRVGDRARVAGLHRLDEGEAIHPVEAQARIGVLALPLSERRVSVGSSEELLPEAEEARVERTALHRRQQRLESRVVGSGERRRSGEEQTERGGEEH